MRGFSTRSGLLVAATLIAALATAGGALAEQPMVYICHITGNGSYELLQVAAPAYPAHIDHGDMDPIDFWADNDGDGFGAGPMFFDCVVPPGFVTNDLDCDDDASSCTSDCTSDGDGDLRLDCLDRCADADKDGYGVDASGSVVGIGAIPIGACTTASGAACDVGPACLGPDCDDAADSCTTTCGDSDTDSRFDCRDACLDGDGDGFGLDNTGATIGMGANTVGACTTDGASACDIGPSCSGPDCDDTDAAINPNATEVCDEVDNDCDGGIDEGVTDTFYRDQDGDTYGDPNDTQEACSAPSGYVANDDDCDDTDGAVNPAATETCNGIDDDCDSSVDEGGVCATKLVFVSSGVYSGNFGGGAPQAHFTDADAVCQGLASDAGLGGTFKAWLSGRPDGFGCGSEGLCAGQDVVDRFTQNPGPYELVNGTKVADSWSDLTDGSLDHAIDRDENGNLFTGTDRVWTNTTTSGLAADVSRTCGQGPNTDTGVYGAWSCGAPTWTAGDCAFQSGKYGFASQSNSTWTGTTDSNTSCADLHHLYCFEQ